MPWELHKLDAYRSGRVTVRDFARALGLDTWISTSARRSTAEAGQGWVDFQAR